MKFSPGDLVLDMRSHAYSNSYPQCRATSDIGVILEEIDIFESHRHNKQDIDPARIRYYKVFFDGMIDEVCCLDLKEFM